MDYPAEFTLSMMDVGVFKSIKLHVDLKSIYEVLAEESKRLEKGSNIDIEHLSNNIKCWITAKKRSQPEKAPSNEIPELTPSEKDWLEDDPFQDYTESLEEFAKLDLSEQADYLIDMIE
jgi:hypothetical protein